MMLASRWHCPAAMYQTCVNLLLYSFVWVIHRRLNCVCRRRGTLVHLLRSCECDLRRWNRQNVPKRRHNSSNLHHLWRWNRQNVPKRRHNSSYLHHLWRWNRRNIPKRRHIKFRRQWIIQRKELNVHNTSKVWYQDMFIYFPNNTTIYILCIRFLFNITTCFGCFQPKHVVRRNM